MGKEQMGGEGGVRLLRAELVRRGPQQRMLPRSPAVGALASFSLWRE